MAVIICLSQRLSHARLSASNVIVHDHAATLCPRAGSNAAKSTTCLQSGLKEPLRVLITRNNPDRRRVPASTEHLWCRSSVGRPTRQRMRRTERRRYELKHRCPSGPGKKSDRSDGSLVDPANSHMLVSNIKPLKSQCKTNESENANGLLKSVVDP
jgi:hypothetical protein